MIITGSAHENPPNINYHKEYYEKGKIKIKEFTNLHKILEDFNGFNEKKYANNIFLNLASSSVSDIFMNDKPNIEAEKRLGDYDKLVQEIKLFSYPKKKRKLIFSKMSSFDREQNKSIVQEFDFYLDLKRFPQISNIIYDDFDGSEHDFRFFIDAEEFNVELTHLGKNEFDTIAQESFTEVAEKLILKIPQGHILKIDVKTDKLLSNGKIDKKYVVDLLIKSIEKMMPIILVDKNNAFFIGNFSDTTKTLFELKNLFDYYNEFGERLNLLLKTREGIAYLKSIKAEDIQNSPIKSILNGDGRGKLIEIHSDCFYPSIAESLREECMNRQFKRVILDKINKNQLASQKNSLLVLQLFDAILFNNYTDKDCLDVDVLPKLKEMVCESFKESGNKFILGVWLYERTLIQSVFIPNPNITISSDTFKKVISLGSIV